MRSQTSSAARRPRIAESRSRNERREAASPVENVAGSGAMSSGARGYFASTVVTSSGGWATEGPARRPMDR